MKSDAGVPLRILIPDAQFAGEETQETQAASDKAAFDVFRTSDPDTIPENVWRACDAVIVWHEMNLTRELIDRLSACRIVVRAGIGFDNIDLIACAERGIPVCNCPDYGTTDVADHAIAMMLALTRGIAFYDHALRKDPIGAWRFDLAPAVRRLRRRILGIVGLGRIGTAVARRARALDMEVRFYDPYVPNGQDLALGFTRCASLAELLEAADVVSLHTPLTDETRDMIDEAALAQMKAEAILVNTARGPLVDPQALLEALRANRICGAALDVLPQEPPAADHPLIEAYGRNEEALSGRLLLTPHSAFFTEEGLQDLRQKPVRTACNYLLDGRLDNCVNLRELERAGHHT